MCCTGTDPSLRLSQYLGATKGHSVAFRVRGPPTLLHWAPLPEATMSDTAEKTHTPGRLHMMAPCQTNEATEGMNLLTPQLGGLLYEWKGEPHVACEVQHTYCIPSVGFQSHSPAPLCYGLDLVRFGSILFSEAHSHPHSPKFSSTLVSLNLQLLRYSVAYGERIFLPAVRNVLQAVSMPWGVRALRPSAELHVEFKEQKAGVTAYLKVMHRKKSTTCLRLLYSKGASWWYTETSATAQRGCKFLQTVVLCDKLV